MPRFNSLLALLVSFLASSAFGEDTNSGTNTFLVASGTNTYLYATNMTVGDGFTVFTNGGRTAVSGMCISNMLGYIIANGRVIGDDVVVSTTTPTNMVILTNGYIITISVQKQAIPGPGYGGGIPKKIDSFKALYADPHGWGYTTNKPPGDVEEIFWDDGKPGDGWGHEKKSAPVPHLKNEAT